MEVLGTEADPGGGTEGLTGRFEGGKGRRQDDIGLGRWGQPFQEVANEDCGLRGRLVHLPVADDEGCAHRFLDMDGVAGVN